MLELPPISPYSASRAALIHGQNSHSSTAPGIMTSATLTGKLSSSFSSSLSRLAVLEVVLRVSRLTTDLACLSVAGAGIGSWCRHAHRSAPRAADDVSALLTRIANTAAPN